MTGRHVRRHRAGPAAVLGSKSRSAPRNSPNVFSDQACPTRPHRYLARDSWPDRRGRPFGDPSRHRSARRPRSRRPRARRGQSCECSRLGSQCRPTPGRPGTCERRPHVSANSISPSGLGGDMGDAQGSPSSHRSACRSAGRLVLRGQPTAEEGDTRGSQGVIPRHVRLTAPGIRGRAAPSRELRSPYEPRQTSRQ
jgi:hypothetical protein